MTLPAIKANEVKLININHLLPDEEQARTTFNEAKLKELAADIKRRGIEQPLTVRKNGADGYIIKHGERRYRAAIIAGLTKVPVVLAKAQGGKTPELDRLFDQYAENMQREDLNAMDMAWFYKRLRDVFEYKIAEIPALLKKHGLKELNPKTIGNHIRNTTLPQWAQYLIRDDQLTAAHGKFLLVAMKSDKVIKTVEEEIKKKLAPAKRNEDSVEEPDTYTTRDLRETIYEAFAEHHTELDSSELDRKNNPDTATFYEPKQLSKEDLKKLNVVKVSAYWDGETAEFIINDEVHEEINTAYKKKWLDANKDKKSTTSKSGNTPETRLGPSDERLTEYLHMWLFRWILDWINSEEETKVQAVQRKIALWLAFGCPDSIRESIHSEGHHVVFDATEDGQTKAVIETKLSNINSFLEHTEDEVPLIKILTAEVIGEMSFNNTCALAKHLQLNIESTYRIDKDYIAMYTRAGIEKLAKATQLDKQDGWDADAKVNTMRSFCIQPENVRFIGCPQDIISMYHTGLNG